MSPHLVRAQMLIQQSRYEMAETELRQALVSDPDDPRTHALHAICMCEMKKFKEATEAANRAIGLAPDSAFVFYVASRVSDARNQLKKAESEIRQAISMDHTNPDFFAQLAGLSIQQKKWQAAMEAAESGLELDPEDVACTNLRAIAMVKLGRNSEAGAAIQSALEKSPEDAVSHANMGWSLLEQGQPKDAMPHFKEALRLEPNMEWARSGIIESMKSQYFIYRMLLNWFLWSSKLDSRTLVVILVGGYVGANVASRVAANNPALRPLLLPLIVAYLAFVIMTWIAVPMFNLLLRFNKFGRLVLSDQEKRVSTLVGSCLAISISLIVFAFAAGYDFFLVPALAVGLLTPIIATYYQSDPGWPRAVHGLLVAGMSMLGLLIIACAFAGYVTDGQTQRAFQGLLNFAITPLVVVGVGGQFAVNFLGMAKPTKGTNTAFLVWLVGGILLALATIGVLAFVAIAIYALSTEEVEPDLGSPIRISLVEDENLQWKHADLVSTGTTKLRKLGFKVGGDYVCPEVPGMKVRFLLHSDGCIIAELFELPTSESLDRSMSVAFDDGRVVNLTNADATQIMPPGWVTRVVAMTETEMFQAMMEEMKQGTPRRFTKPELASFTSDQYAIQNDFLLNRGGLTDQEVREQAERIGIHLNDEALHRFQTKWSRDAEENIERFVIDQFVKTNPEFDDKRGSLCCINRYTLQPGAGVIQVMTLLPYLKKAEVDELRALGEVEPTTFPEQFYLRINPESISRVGQTTVPVPTDIYLKK